VPAALGTVQVSALRLLGRLSEMAERECEAADLERSAQTIPFYLLHVLSLRTHAQGITDVQPSTG
jgi:hypothetical protein